jgi:glycosyltransferase involved in cell wall biosynthesis
LVGDISSLPRNLIVDLSRDPIINALARFYDDKTYREHLESRVPNALKDRLHFIGNVPQADLVAYYKAADVFVLPSSCHEAFGMPLAEAMACGKPTVGARGGGIPELFEDGRTGFVVEREDPAALAEAIGKLLDDPGLRSELGRRGRERCRELFSWDVIAMETEKRYEWAQAHRPRS